METAHPAHCAGRGCGRFPGSQLMFRRYRRTDGFQWRYDVAQGQKLDSSGDPEDQSVTLEQQGVSAGHPLAAEAGTQMLNQGGNAIDAAIAAAFAVSVVEPYASGIGGGGSVLIASPDDAPQGVDYREVVAQDGQIPASNIGIPGFVAGMADLHEQRGSLEWNELLRPAVDMAQQGVPVTETLVQRIGAGSRGGRRPGAVRSRRFSTAGGR